MERNRESIDGKKTIVELKKLLSDALEVKELSEFSVRTVAKKAGIRIKRATTAKRSDGRLSKKGEKNTKILQKLIQFIEREFGGLLTSGAAERLAEIKRASYYMKGRSLSEIEPTEGSGQA